jgi:mannose-6-phosphate isomerase-like protein (cupin superfamily)
MGFLIKRNHHDPTISNYQREGFMIEEIYPIMITGLPEVEIPFNGIKGWLLQGIDKQVVFFDIEPDASIPEHSHGEQWGVVVDGEAELVVNGVKKVCRKGDTYYIPAGAVHSVTFRTRLKTIDFFAEPNRYKPKSET